MFKLVVITLPYSIQGEVQALNSLASRADIHSLHLRKPGFPETEMRAFLASLSEPTLRKVRIHSHYALAGEFPLHGIHLTSHSALPEDYNGSFSASCHSLEEVRLRLNQGCDYVFLSPVFDSISKPGYRSSFTSEQLRNADLTNVIALGGITSEKIPLLKDLGFAGAALSGYVWKNLNEINSHL